MKASEFLSQARDELAAGWTTGTLEDRMGNVCSVGALARTAAMQQPQTFDDFTRVCEAGNRASAALEMVIKELRGSDPQASVTIMGFNDSSRTEMADVLNAFEKAIIQLEERGE